MAFAQEDKLTCIQQNILLNDYYLNKGQFPHKLLSELQRLATHSMGVVPEGAPDCKIAADGSQVIMGDLTKPYSGGASTQSMSSS